MHSAWNRGQLDAAAADTGSHSYAGAGGKVAFASKALVCQTRHPLLLRKSVVGHPRPLRFGNLHDTRDDVSELGT